MAKAAPRRRKAVSRPSTRRSARKRRGWVRKNVLVDQRKLDTARRTFGVDTETEAIDLALDAVAFRREITRGLDAIARRGGIVDIFEDRQKG
jgi:hypothetical protein